MFDRDYNSYLDRLEKISKLESRVGGFSPMLPYNRRLKTQARSLRTNPTDAELHRWYRLRRKQILGVQFYRQKPIGNYIAHFYAPAAKLVVEPDGLCQREKTSMAEPSARKSA